jgi:hypothetical protein
MPALLAPLLALSLATLDGAPPKPPIQAESLVIGRVVFVGLGKELPWASLGRPGEKLSLALRRGWDVVEVAPDSQGFFTAKAAPGLWHLDYVSLGNRSEFFSPGLEVEVRLGETLCLGQIEVAFQGDFTDLGSNRSKTTVSDRCCGGDGSKGSTARLPMGLARPAAPPPRHSPQLIDYFLGLRGEISGALSGKTSTSLLRASYLLPITGPLAERGTLLGLGAVDFQSLPAGWARVYSLGAGYSVTDFLEVTLAGSFGEGPSLAPGFGGWTGLRLGIFGFGFDLRLGYAGPGVSASLGFDLAPVFLAGSLL